MVLKSPTTTHGSSTIPELVASNIVGTHIDCRNNPLIVAFPRHSSVNKLVWGLNDVNFPRASIPNIPNASSLASGVHNEITRKPNTLGLSFGPLTIGMSFHKKHKRRVVLLSQVFKQRCQAYGSCPQQFEAIKFIRTDCVKLALRAKPLCGHHNWYSQNPLLLPQAWEFSFHSYSQWSPAVGLDPPTHLALELGM